MMATLSRPDWRDATSLPPQDIAWDAAAAEPRAAVRGLKIGLLMDAGWGLPLDAEIAAAVQAAPRSFEHAGAVVEAVAPFTTREMADGINLFCACAHGSTSRGCRRRARPRYWRNIRDWAAAGQTCSATELFHGYSQFATLRDAAVAACRRHDFVISPVAPVSAFAAEWASPTNDPLRAMEHIAYTLPYNMSEQARHQRALRPHRSWPADRPADHRPAPRRPRRAAAAHAWEGLRPPLRPWPAPP